MSSFSSFDEAKGHKNTIVHGELKKQQRKWNRWISRHYVLNGDTLLYFDSLHSRDGPKKTINLHGAQVLPFVRRDGELHGFMVTTTDGGPSHALFASSEQLSQQWIDAINKASNASKPAPSKQPVPKKAERSPASIMAMKRSYSRAANKIEDVYEVKEELGTGGFSVVKRGIHKGDGQNWALKMIRNSVFQKNKERTEEEVAVLAALSHPNIVHLREVVRTPKYYVIVMEYLEGGELFDRIVQREKYSENDAKTVVAEILEAIKYLHQNNVVHRDLKPENLIFDRPTENATLKLTDFGFATLYDDTQKLTATCGTPEYVAPEILDEKTYDSAVDMWSMGVISYILLCGFPPFYGDNEQELFNRICCCKYKFLSPYWDKISDEAKDFVRKLLTLDSSKRYTADQALKHPWIRTVVDNAADLGGAQIELKRYNATRKFRKAVLAVLAANKMRIHLKDLGIDGKDVKKRSKK